MSVQSSELVPPTPSPGSECGFLPLGSWGEPHYSLAGEGVGGSNSDDWTDIMVSYAVVGTTGAEVETGETGYEE